MMISTSAQSDLYVLEDDDDSAGFCGNVLSSEEQIVETVLKVKSIFHCVMHTPFWSRSSWRVSATRINCSASVFDICESFLHSMVCACERSNPDLVAIAVPLVTIEMVRSESQRHWGRKAYQLGAEAKSE